MGLRLFGDCLWFCLCQHTGLYESLAGRCMFCSQRLPSRLRTVVSDPRTGILTLLIHLSVFIDNTYI